MTFGEIISPTQTLIDPKTQDVFKKVREYHRLFGYSENHVPILTKIYVLCKHVRIGSYMDVMLMDPDDRDELFETEKKLNDKPEANSFEQQENLQ